MRIALVLALPLFGACAANAFEFEGYRSGMSLAAAHDHARLRGDRIEADGVELRGVGLGTNYEVIKSDGRTFILDFCDDQLFWLHLKIEGGLYAFATMARELREKHGEPVFDEMASPRELAVQIAKLSLTWEVEDEQIEVSLDSTGPDLPGASILRTAPRLCEEAT